ncbi:YgiQ family radical SAM protein [Thiolapillus sp.]
MPEKTPVGTAEIGKPSARDIFSYRKYWAHKFTPAPFLPMSREEMDDLGWDSCDIIIVTGDAYVDQASFGMAIVGRLLEAQGFRVGIIAQPRWQDTQDFMKLGRPNLFFGVTAGNMDSMVNRYTSDRKIRSDDAYTPNAEGGRRPDRASLVYSQRCKEAYKGIPVVIGGIEASLRRIAHYDYWQDKVRHSALVDSKADILLYGNAERAIVELAHRLAAGESIRDIRDLRGTAVLRNQLPEDFTYIDSTDVEAPGPARPRPDPYASTPNPPPAPEAQVVTLHSRPKKLDRTRTAILLPSYEQVKRDPVLYAHASRILHLESNPGNARALVQQHGKRYLWVNPPPIPLTTRELDRVYELPYQRRPHPAYGDARIPAWEMIRFSINIMRGCFGGCTFCSITEHEGRIIQNRSEESILKEIEAIRDNVPGFTGNISDLGGPTANMWRLHCKDPKIEASCRRLSCVYPGICKNMKTDQMPLVRLYRKARAIPGIKRIFIASGLRYDLAVETPEYVKELVTHHVGGYLKIAPEHTEQGPLSHMMKPGIGTYDRFKALFDKYSRAAGKEQYLIPYFIAAHPGTTDEDMLNLALWLKRNGFRADQVQAYLPSPMALATAMWHTGHNPLKKVTRGEKTVFSPRGMKQRRLHKAFLRYHDANNWPLLREALKKMGRADLIGNGKHQLVPRWQPKGTGGQEEATPRPFRTKHTSPAKGKPTRRRPGTRKRR